MAMKAPEKLLTLTELVYLTGFERKKVARMMISPEDWAKPGGAKLIAGDYRLPLSFYNAWVDSMDIATPPSRREKEAAHA
jgi:hypothetical protein